MKGDRGCLPELSVWQLHTHLFKLSHTLCLSLGGRETSKDNGWNRRMTTDSFTGWRGQTNQHAGIEPGAGWDGGGRGGRRHPRARS